MTPLSGKELTAHIGWCHAQRDRALNILADLETRGLRIWAMAPGGDMVETTQERVAELRDIVSEMDRLLAIANSG